MTFMEKKDSNKAAMVVFIPKAQLLVFQNKPFTVSRLATFSWTTFLEVVQSEKVLKLPRTKEDGPIIEVVAEIVGQQKFV